METVTKCEKVKDWTSQKTGQTVPIYAIGFSDGQGGQSFGKLIPVGTPVSDLILEPGEYGLKVKMKSAAPSGGGFGKGSRGGNESFALSYSKDLVVAGKVDLKLILPMADKFYAWLESKKEGPKAEEPIVTTAKIHADLNDLPF
jgi:hypothetical protein